MPTIQLPRPLPPQVPILISGARYKVLACGRRFGKSTIALDACIEGHGPVVDGKPMWPGAIHGARIWWIAPIYKQALGVWDLLKAALRTVGTVSEAEWRITLPNGGWVQVRSGDNPDTLRGTGLDGCVLDEAAMMPPELWSQVIRPSLADRKGWCIFASTPRGAQNWFHDVYTSAADNPEWERWHLRTEDNPRIPPEELAAMRADMSEQEAAQELDASWLTTAEQRFGPVGLANGKRLICPPLETLPLPDGLGPEYLRVWEMPRAGMPYVVYTDPSKARGRDYTCTVVVESRTLRHVATLRDNVLEPTQHGAKAVLLAQWYNTALYGCESNIGEAILYAVGASGYPRVYWHPRQQTLRMRLDARLPDRELGLPVTAQTRPGLIDDLAAEIDSGRLTSPDGVFWAECDTFVLDAKGRAAAMDGKHDDLVLAMAGALRIARSPGAQQTLGGGRPKVQARPALGGVYAQWR